MNGSGENCIICGVGGELVRPCACGPVHARCAAETAPDMVCRTCGNTYAHRSVTHDEFFQLLKGLGVTLVFIFGATSVVSLFAFALYFFTFMFGKASVIVFLVLFVIVGLALALWLVFRISMAEKTRRVVVDAEDTVVELDMGT